MRRGDSAAQCRQNAVIVMARLLRVRCRRKLESQTRKWIEQNLTDGAEDNTTSNDPCDRYDSWDLSNKICYGFDVTPHWDASWCIDQDGTECGRFQDSLVSNETRKWIEYKNTLRPPTILAIATTVESTPTRSITAGALFNGMWLVPAQRSCGVTSCSD